MSRHVEDLALYHYDSCGFCARVRGVAADLGIEIPMRNILEEPQALRELMAARGRRTVPVLRITEDGKERWMGESVDIIRYLRERFANA